MPRPKLTLFLDVVSPFAYMAYYVTRYSRQMLLIAPTRRGRQLTVSNIQNSPVFKQCDITYIPIFLGGVMQACGNTPPIKIKNKDNYIGLDRTRSAKRFNIPIVTNVPEGFPPNTLPAQRALCTIQSQHPEKLSAALDALYQAFWAEGKPIGEAQVVEEGLARVFGGEQAKEIVASVAKPEVKKLLNDNTQAALESGAFGLPWFVATDAQGGEDVFFGFDRLHMVVEHLGLGEGENGLRALL